jgi:hypothetical protein
LMLPPAHGPDQPDDPTVCDLGFRLLRRLWRQGLPSEACRTLLRMRSTHLGTGEDTREHSARRARSAFGVGL